MIVSEFQAINKKIPSDSTNVFGTSQMVFYPNMSALLDIQKSTF
jgi:hypothetical protein